MVEIRLRPETRSSVRAYIRRVEDGKIVRVSYTQEGTGAGTEFFWTEGNFGCDCNRALLVHRALDEDEPDDPPCTDGRFSLECLVVNEVLEIGTVEPASVDGETGWGADPRSPLTPLP